MSGDWHDPFAEDKAAREREARRAEREARRRERRERLGRRVSEGMARTLPPSAGGPASGPPEGSSKGGERRERPSETERREQPAGERPELPLGRVVGALAVLALAGLLVFGVVTLLDGIGGGGEGPAPRAKPLKVEGGTIPEGLDRRQIAELAKEAGLRGDYVAAAESARGFDTATYGAEDPPNLEGFLFPATYELERDTKVEDLVAKQLDAFEQNIAEVDLSYARSKNLTAYDVLIIASMIEREVQVERERRLVAAVIYNRLAAGNPLGIDATIRYEDQNYDEPLETSRLEQDTAYNTHTNAGLPPTPIGNPGLASIEAAANPAKSDAFYFVVKPYTCGEHVFSETQAEHAEAEAEYQAALEAEGGAPTEC